jgi:hypothetical protein
MAMPVLLQRLVSIQMISPVKGKLEKKGSTFVADAVIEQEFPFK